MTGSATKMPTQSARIPAKSDQPAQQQQPDQRQQLARLTTRRLSRIAGQKSSCLSMISGSANMHAMLR